MRIGVVERDHLHNFLSSHRLTQFAKKLVGKAYLCNIRLSPRSRVPELRSVTRREKGCQLILLNNYYIVSFLLQFFLNYTQIHALVSSF